MHQFHYVLQYALVAVTSEERPFLFERVKLRLLEGKGETLYTLGSAGGSFYSCI